MCSYCIPKNLPVHVLVKITHVTIKGSTANLHRILCDIQTQNHNV